MSHPLRDTIPAARCASCEHFAPVGEVTECQRPGCGCSRHTGSPYAGHDPATPPGAEAALEYFKTALTDAREALEKTANEEVDAEMDLDEKRRELLLSDQCPQAAGPGRTCTVGYQNAWIDTQPGVTDLIRTHRHAKAKREAAEKVLKTLERVSSLQQTITGSVRESYRGQRGAGW